MTLNTPLLYVYWPYLLIFTIKYIYTINMLHFIINFFVYFKGKFTNLLALSKAKKTLINKQILETENLLLPCIVLKLFYLKDF